MRHASVRDCVEDGTEDHSGTRRARAGRPHRQRYAHDPAPTLLFLAHRIPYPPNKGEKLRAYHLLRGLAETHDVWLGAPVDDPDDWRWRDALDDLCVETRIADGRGRSRHRAGLAALARGEAVTFSYFRHRSLMDWVTRVTTERRFDAAFLYSSGTMPYLDAMAQAPARLIVDFVDADSEKWRALATRGGGHGPRSRPRGAVAARCRARPRPAPRMRAFS